MLSEEDVNFTSTVKGGVVLNTDNDESRRAVELCYRTTSTLVNPIIDWTDEEVWEFLRMNDCDSNPLYQFGYKRIGCIGCPLSGSHGMKKGFANYPEYKENYIRAFDRMIEKLKAKKGKEYVPTKFVDGKTCMTWWLGDNPNQITIEQYMQEMESNDGIYGQA